MINKIKQSTQARISNYIKTIATVGTTLFITLTAGANPANTEVKKEIAAIFKKNPDKEIVVKVENNQSEEKTAKFEMTPDTLKDPYDQIRSFVNTEDINYFNQLKTHIETKDSVEQIRCKAVIYAILQDKELSEEQRQTLALAYFERLARMPWSNYRFRTTGNKKYEGDQAYADRRNWYSGYKSYLDVVALDLEIAKLDEKNKQLDEEIKILERQVKLFKGLLETYKNYKK